MEKKASKNDIVESERRAWADVLKRLEFFTETVCARTDKILVQDAYRKLSGALDNYRSAYKQRMASEFAKA